MPLIRAKLRYLGAYSNFIRQQLEQGSVFFLLDGLDEIADASLRIQIVRQIETFTRAYPKNRFIVTSRIVAYKEAQLAADYQPYTLADFSEQQIRTFTQQWCLAYECWVKGTMDSQHLRDAALKESEKLFQATQRNPGVNRLAVNPLLLTILALIQRQGIQLPDHRIELYDLCATTLIDTWVNTRESATRQAPHFSKNELVKILRPLAFWMHEHPQVGAIPESELTEQIVKQLLERRITRDEVEAAKRAEQFLATVRGQTGILVERGKQRYGFLHQTFEEYFAARELETRRNRNDFIKQYLHSSRWQEAIRLTASAVGVLQANEKGVTEIVEEVILKAESPFEEWLHRDLLFAGYCLADDVGVSAACEDDIIERIVYLYLTSPYDSLREAFSSVLTAWSDTRAAIKAVRLMLSVFRKQEMIADMLPASPTASISRPLKFEEKIAAYYQCLIQRHLESRINLLRLQIITILHHLQVDMANRIRDVLAMLADSGSDVRRAAATALGQVGSGQPEVVQALLSMLTDSNWQVREAAATALGQVGSGQPEVVQALLSTLTDSGWQVREAAATALGQVGSGQPEVVQALLSTLTDSVSDVRRAAASALATLRIDRETVGLHIEGLLRRYSPIASEQLEADASIDALLFALQQVIGSV